MQHRQSKPNINVWTVAVLILSFSIYLAFMTLSSEAMAPVLAVSNTVGTDEPLIGGEFTIDIDLTNTGATPVTDKGYNLTISNTLPISVTYVSATVSPTFVEEQADGTTLVIWDNISDLEVDEELNLSITAALDARIEASDLLTNTVVARFNEAPDNSLNWVEVTDDLVFSAQVIDIEVEAIQSTADQQATGAGEYDGYADWRYQYQVTVKNNNVASTDGVVATVDLPAGVAYMGNPVISPNPNGSSADPTINLNGDGSLTLEWPLGTMTTNEYSSPVVITFDAAIPYKYRTAADTAAIAGAFAGPMSGAVIPEDAVMPVTYEVTGEYDSVEEIDGTTATPEDDAVEIVIAEYLTISKSASPFVVGHGSTVNFTINYYVSEYYTTTNVIITDVMPDGMTYVGASMLPSSVENDTPGDGQTRITFDIPRTDTTPTASGSIVLTATVDTVYEASPYTNEPIVSGDSLTNQAGLTNDWEDIVTEGRADTGIPDASNATVTTRMPTLTKEVRDEDTGLWGDLESGFTGDTVYFRITYNQAADVDGKMIVIRDFLPRGMTFVNGTDTYNNSGAFNNDAPDCTVNATSPTIGTLNGLQYLEWKLCSVDKGSTWEGTFGAILGETPDVQAGWLVANFGKASGQNTIEDGYSLRDLANVSYDAPDLVLTKTADVTQDLEGNDTVNYTISVTNNGDATAYRIDLTDTVPEWLIIAGTGGSASPSSSSYTSTGDVANGNGGTLNWSRVDSLAVGETLTYQYAATVKSGVAPGEALNNIASIAYNSRSDGNGHQVDVTSDTADYNTDDETVYVRGITVSKSDSPSTASIGDIVTWTITGVVPDGVTAYYPVVEEKLPNGFDYIRTVSVTDATLATLTGSPANPKDDGNREVTWFLDTMTNNSGSDMTFTIVFESMVTGVNGNNSDTEYFTNNCKNNNPKNYIKVGWYGDAAGAGSNESEYSDNPAVDYQSPETNEKTGVRQPCLTISKSSEWDYVDANGIYYYDLTIENTGGADAYDVVLTDTLPTDISYNGPSTPILAVSPDPGGVSYTSSNVDGASNLTFGASHVPAGATFTVRYWVKVAADVSAEVTGINTAEITYYDTQAGDPGDTNADGVDDQRSYTGPTASDTIYTPEWEIGKTASAPSEFTFGSTIIYTLTMPTTPINATIYDVVITDSIDSRLEIVNVTNGAAVSNTVNASFSSIAPNQQEVIVIEATLPADSSAIDGDVILNQAQAVSDNASDWSDAIYTTVMVPALEIDKVSNEFVTAVGDTLFYTMTVRNVGTGTAESVTIADNLPTNQTFLNGATGSWSLGSLAGGAEVVTTFQTSVDSAVDGVNYVNIASVSGLDTEGAIIPADNSTRVPADSDLTDTGKAAVYGGPLACSTYVKHVAFEDLKNTSWTDWDYNDLIVKLESELCYTPSAAQFDENDLREINACSDVEIEAESGTLTGFTAVSDGNASGGQYIHVPDTGGYIASDPSDSTKAEYTFTVTTPGTYRLVGLAEGVDLFGDTFWYKINSLDSRQTSISRDGGFQSDYFNDVVNGIDPYEVDLSAGTHSLIIYNREDGARLDKITVECQSATDTVVPDTLATATVTYTLMARGAGFNHQLAHEFPITGGGQYHMVGYDSNDAVIADTQGNLGETASINIFDDTHTAIPIIESNPGPQTNTAPEQTEWVKGHWAVLEIALNDNATHPVATLQPFPWDIHIPVKNTGEEVHLLVPGHLDNTQVVNDVWDANSPLLGYDMPMAFTFEGDWTWPLEFNGIWRAYPNFVDYIDSGRTTNLDWYAAAFADQNYLWTYFTGGRVAGPEPRLGADSRYFSAPVVVDIDGDSINEIIIGDLRQQTVAAYTGGQTELWSVTLDGGLKGGPVVGDINNDGTQEVVIGAEDGYLYALSVTDGSAVSGFPVQISENRLLATPTLADVDGNGSIEILIPAGNGRLYVRNGDGTPMWNASLGDVVDTVGNQVANSGAVVADIDGDGDMEIVAGSYDKHVYVLDHEGNELWRYLTGDIVISTPAVADITPEYAGMEIFFGSGDGYVYLLQNDGSLIWRRQTAWSVRSSALVTDMDGDSFMEVVIGSDDDSVYAWHFYGEMVEGWPNATTGDVFSSPTVGDVDNDGQDEIIVGSDDAKVYSWEMDGTAVTSWPKSTEASVKARPVVADVDEDDELEVISGDFDGNLFVWGTDLDTIYIYTPLIQR